jgi:hypothetical protein
VAYFLFSKRRADHAGWKVETRLNTPPRFFALGAGILHSTQRAFLITGFSSCRAALYSIHREYSINLEIPLLVEREPVASNGAKSSVTEGLVIHAQSPLGTLSCSGHSDSDTMSDIRS